jgi:hypothetical protein
VATTVAQTSIDIGSIDCPHCHKPFIPEVDLTQRPRFQGAKCPGCNLFVPWGRIQELSGAE